MPTARMQDNEDVSELHVRKRDGRPVERLRLRSISINKSKIQRPMAARAAATPPNDVLLAQFGTRFPSKCPFIDNVWVSLKGQDRLYIGVDSPTTAFSKRLAIVTVDSEWWQHKFQEIVF